MANLPTLVLITAARNEAEFIEKTIQSVLRQTVRPIKWVIVSDGSTDGTDDIVRRYTDDHPWIELIRTPERRERHFAGKVNAFNAGYRRVSDLQYDIIGNIDADISFDEDHLEYLLNKFVENPRLGVAGTSYIERDGTIPYDYRFASADNVPGASQLFRRNCFEDIGGYAAIKGGLVDTVAVLSARMKGWETKTFTGKMFLHHRSSGTAQTSILVARFRRGAKSYALGNHPIWEFFRTAYQMTRKPLVIGALAMLAGYLWSVVRRTKRPVSDELVAFHRREQLQILRRLFTGRWMMGRKTWEQKTPWTRVS